MCGIVGYVGGRPALDVVVEGLARLEYRGYDSAGVAVLADGKLATAKRAGKLVNLRKALEDEPPPAGTLGMGHTRWATHGPPNDRNAHPHVDCTGSVAVIHNGIIENFAELRAELEENGHGLGSDTDTEAVAHLLEDELKAGGGLAEAMRSVCRRLEGAFTLVAVHTGDPDLVVGARRNSPLVVGVGDGENFLASDVAAFIAHTRDAIELGQDQVVELRTGGVTVTDFEGRPAEVKEYHVDWDVSAAEKGGFDYFMLKEIAEQPRAVADTLLGRIGTDGRLHLDEMRISDQELREVDKIIIVACGTSYHAGLIANLAGSPELHQRAGGSDEAYVGRVYEVLLGRSPDASGHGYWVTRLEGGMSRWRLATHILGSIESRRDRVAGAYQLLLLRSPDAAGLEHWAGRLPAIDDLGLVVALLASPEYIARRT